VIAKTAVGARSRALLYCNLETVALVSAGFGVLSLAPFTSSLRAVLLVAFILVGPGVAVVMWMRLQPAASLVAIPVIGLSALTGLSALLAWVNHWLPIQLLGILVGFVAISALLHTWQPERRATLALIVAHTVDWRVNGSLICIVASLIAWALLLPGMSDVPDSQFGLLFVGTGPGLAIISAVLVVAFLSALHKNRLVTAAIAIAAIIVVLRVTATLITEAPIYTWTYKHVGVVDYIQHYRALPPSGVDVYREWPTFFTAFAWLGDITSVDVFVVAHWFAPVIHVLLAICIGALAVLLGLGIKQAFVAVMIAELVNWVGQDYFAPQAVALVLAIGMLALLAASKTRPDATSIALLAFAAVIPLHQLTPYWLVAATALLVVARLIRPWWLPIPMGIMLIGYLIPRRYIVMPHGIFSGSDPLSNGATNEAYAGSVGKLFTSMVCRGLSVTVVLLAAVAVVVWWRQRRPFAFPAIIAFTPFCILFMNDYGGEAIFRVYLYALAGCVILIAPLLTWATAPIRGHVAINRIKALLAAVLLSGSAVSALQSYYGLWPLIVPTRSQLTIFQEFMDGIHGPATIWSLHPMGFPTRITAGYVKLAQYDDNFDAPIFERWPELSAGFPETGQFDEVTGAAQHSGGENYFVFTAQAIFALDYFGNCPPVEVAKFEEQFRRSEFWSVRFQDDRTTIYQFQSLDAHRGGFGR
jgi:hypothetical protein